MRNVRFYAQSHECKRSPQFGVASIAHKATNVASSVTFSLSSASVVGRRQPLRDGTGCAQALQESLQVVRQPDCECDDQRWIGETGRREDRAPGHVQVLRFVDSTVLIHYAVPREARAWHS